MSRRLPRVGSVIEITLGGPDGRAYRACLEEAEGGRLAVSLPADPRLRAAPVRDHPAFVRWSAGPLGSASAPARLSLEDGVSARLLIELVGPVELKQNRRFVRGGGCETVELRREVADDRAVYTGWVVDLSEASIRARFADLPAAVGESVSLGVDLGGPRVEALGQVLKVTPGAAGDMASIVVGYELEEAQASAVRRYLLRREMLVRSRRHNA
ncbi:MAG TPA: hypothetical protein VJT31_11640 [Rugosimonospora sp.]|nr:hypothetical protein [Rugosimonospora sp.]